MPDFQGNFLSHGKLGNVWEFSRDILWSISDLSEIDHKISLKSNHNDILVSRYHYSDTWKPRYHYLLNGSNDEMRMTSQCTEWVT